MKVDKNAGKPTHNFEGTTYYFCCQSCQKKFSSDPHKYLHPSPEPAAPPPPKGTPAPWTLRSSRKARASARFAAWRLSPWAFHLLLVAIDSQPAGILAVAYPIKPSARSAVGQLRELGLNVVMATGDRRETAEAVARELGIAEIHSGLLPEEKSRLISELKIKGHAVAFAGDGINDAVALSTANAGVAMGTGADVAIESAGITLPKGDLRSLVRTRLLAAATVSNIKQNLAFAFGYNALGIPIAAGVLYPVFGLLLSPMIAALAMSLSSVSVISNALRLGQKKLSVASN